MSGCKLGPSSLRANSRLATSELIHMERLRCVSTSRGKSWTLIQLCCHSCIQKTFIWSRILGAMNKGKKEGVLNDCDAKIPLRPVSSLVVGLSLCRRSFGRVLIESWNALGEGVRIVTAACKGGEWRESWYRDGTGRESSWGHESGRGHNHFPVH